jgi:predicted RNA-binding protein YlxR (DUF448 family)
MCIACRESKAKGELVRLVRTPDGQLLIDETGRQNGRGAYLCRQSTCWETALKGHQIERALDVNVGDKERQLLRDFTATL